MRRARRRVAALRPGGVAAVAGRSCVAAAGRARSRPPPAGGSLLDEVFPDGLPYPFAAVLDRLRAVGRPGARDDGADPARPLAAALRRRRPTTSPRRGWWWRSPATARPGRAMRGSPTGCSSATSRRRRWSRRSATTPPPGASSSRKSSATPSAAPPLEPARAAGLPRLPPGPRADLRPPALERDQRQSRRSPARLAALGPDFHGAPVRADASTRSTAFDAATDRAARIAAGEPALVGGLPRPGLPRGALGRRAALRPRRARRRQAPAARPAFDARTPRALARGHGRRSRPTCRTATRWPPARGLETTGALNPETPRAPVVLWRPGATASPPPPARSPAQFAPGDLAWVDAPAPGSRGGAAADASALACARAVRGRRGDAASTAPPAQAGCAASSRRRDGAHRVLWLGAAAARWRSGPSRRRAPAGRRASRRGWRTAGGWRTLQLAGGTARPSAWSTTSARSPRRLDARRGRRAGARAGAVPTAARCWR